MYYSVILCPRCEALKIFFYKKFVFGYFFVKKKRKKEKKKKGEKKREHNKQTNKTPKTATEKQQMHT